MSDDKRNRDQDQDMIDHINDYVRERSLAEMIDLLRSIGVYADE